MNRTVAECRERAREAFSLLELMVVLATISVLASTLLMALRGVRAESKAVACGGQLRQTGTALLTWLTDHGKFPASYVYPGIDGDWGPGQGRQNAGQPRGYRHWSQMMVDGSLATEGMFQCPTMNKGGAPRANPGPNARDWESGQVDEHGLAGPNASVDQQAARMAYTANAAIIPANNFTTARSGGSRVNRLVGPDEITDPGRTIVVTEFLDNWRAIGTMMGTGRVLSRSHRPVVPFVHLALPTDQIYRAQTYRSGFIYPDPCDLLPYDVAMSASSLITANVELDAAGRHHPGSLTKCGGEMGGTMNSVYGDFHVERMHVWHTIRDRLWGDAFYSITGANDVLNF